MLTRNGTLKILLVLGVSLSVAGGSSYYLSDHMFEMYKHPTEIIMSISLIIFALSCIYLLKVKSYLYYNNLVTLFFSAYCAGKIYLVVVNYPSESFSSSLSSIFIGLTFPAVFWLVLHIPNKVLLRHNKIYLK